MKLFLLSLLALSTFAFTQPATPQAVPPLPSASSSDTDYRQAEKAYREFLEAQEERQKVERLTRGGITLELSFLSQGDTILEQARANYEAGDYFATEQRAKAAEALYEATLELADFDRRPDDDDLEDANEELARAEAELEYYRSADTTVQELIGQARSLLTNPLHAEAAEEVSKAALYLIAAERGF